MKKGKNRMGVLTLAAALMLTLLSGCGGEAPAPEAEEPVEIHAEEPEETPENEGFIPEVLGELTELKLNFGSISTRAKLFAPIPDCGEFTFHFRLDKVYTGYPYGRWRIYGQTPDEHWERLGEFFLEKGDMGTEITVPVVLDSPMELKGIVAVPANGDEDLHWVSDFWMSEVSTTAWETYRGNTAEEQRHVSGPREKTA